MAIERVETSSVKVVLKIGDGRTTKSTTFNHVNTELEERDFEEFGRALANLSTAQFKGMSRVVTKTAAESEAAQ